MKEQEYNSIVVFITSYKKSLIGSKRKLEQHLKQAFPHVPDQTLNSIFTFEYQRKTKRERPRHFKQADSWYRLYIKRLPSAPGILLKMADEFDISPSLLARMILEKHYDNLAAKDDTFVSSKNLITKGMKDTTLIEDPTLAYEIFLCVLHDDQYGPISECINHSIGQEYEFKLHEMVTQLGIPFSGEEHLRTKGYDKTPDVKLEVPFAIDGFIVNWIESKALFGDNECHENYMKEQFLSYWNRFGTGLVIYWFGHLDHLESLSGKKIIIRDSFPTDIVKMNPEVIQPSTIVF